MISKRIATKIAKYTANLNNAKKKMTSERLQDLKEKHKKVYELVKSGNIKVDRNVLSEFRHAIKNREKSLNKEPEKSVKRSSSRSRLHAR